MISDLFVENSSSAPNDELAMCRSETYSSWGLEYSKWWTIEVGFNVNGALLPACTLKAPRSQWQFSAAHTVVVLLKLCFTYELIPLQVSCPKVDEENNFQINIRAYISPT